MGRLIDADEVNEAIYKSFEDMQFYDGTGYDVYSDSKEIIDKIPTVEAIPKDQYEARLKADLVAILDEFDLRLYEQYDDTDLIKVKYVRQAIQQKIDGLKLKKKEFHCGFEESGGHAYNCNDCPNKCEEWYQWDKEFRKKGE